MMTAGALTESLAFGSQTPINKSAVCVQKEPATKSWKVGFSENGVLGGESDRESGINRQYRLTVNQIVAFGKSQ